jgi:hypothetical protein
MDQAKLLQRLEDEGQHVLRFFNQLDETAWELQIYTEDEVWTIHQILAHFVSVERAFQWLIDNILTGGTGTPEDFDLDRFNHEQVRALQDLAHPELLAIFQTERATTLSQASHYTPTDMQKEGRHPWFGQLSVKDILKLLYRHNMLHMRDIRRRLAA